MRMEMCVVLEFATSRIFSALACIASPYQLIFTLYPYQTRLNLKNAHICC